MSIALDKNAQSNFSSAVQNIKKLLKKGKLQVKDDAPPVQIKKKKIYNRGVVYIGHIPHGFYEEAMQGYFSQFGKVTNVRVMRSQKTGKSKGYAFVEFLHQEVAQIVADTMNNYLMNKRLLKAAVIPPEKLNPKLFRGSNWSESKYPGLKNRKKEINFKNRHQTIKEERKTINKSCKRLNKTLKKLKEAGIEYGFTISDLPEWKNTTTETEVKSEESSGESSNEAELVIDESDNDIEFNVPSNTRISYLKERKSSLKINRNKDESNLLKNKIQGIVKRKSGKNVIKTSKKSTAALKSSVHEILNSDNVVLKSLKDIKKKKMSKY